MCEQPEYLVLESAMELTKATSFRPLLRFLFEQGMKLMISLSFFYLVGTGGYEF